MEGLCIYGVTVSNPLFRVITLSNNMCVCMYLPVMTYILDKACVSIKVNTVFPPSCVKATGPWQPLLNLLNNLLSEKHLTSER